MKFIMQCRIDDIENHEGNFYHVVTTPAPDAYTKPSSFKLRSRNQIGQVGQVFECECVVSGNVYAKPIVKDGVKKIFNEARVYLDVTNSKPVVPAK